MGLDLFLAIFGHFWAKSGPFRGLWTGQKCISRRETSYESCIYLYPSGASKIAPCAFKNFRFRAKTALFFQFSGTQNAALGRSNFLGPPPTSILRFMKKKRKIFAKIIPPPKSGAVCNNPQKLKSC